jgi:uncharacterized LabA/DUF88 family protein
MSTENPNEQIEVPLLYAHIADAREHAESERAREHLREACEYVITLEENQEKTTERPPSTRD